MDSDNINAINATLKQLALQAQSAPQGSLQRRVALDHLIRTLQGCKFLYRPPRNRFPHLYEEVCDEAMQRLFVHICKKIDQYNPKYEVTQWVNFLLKRCFFPQAWKEVISDHLALEEWDGSDPKISSLIEQILEYIKTDPEQCLNTVHVKDHPDITFQVLALEILAGYKWREIAAKFDLSISTLCTFYLKHLKRFASQIRAYIQNNPPS